MSCHAELTFLPSSWDGKRGHSVHRCREAKQRWTLQTPRHCISCCWPSVLNASTLVLWQEYWVSHREENTVDSLDGKMMVHSPGRTNFNTLHRMLHNTGYKLLNSRIFHWLFPMVDGVTTRHTGLAGWHGHRPYSAASSDMIVISLTNALTLNEFKAVLQPHQPLSRTASHPKLVTAEMGGMDVKHVHLQDLFSLSQSYDAGRPCCFPNFTQSVKEFHLPKGLVLCFWAEM